MYTKGTYKSVHQHCISKRPELTRTTTGGVAPTQKPVHTEHNAVGGESSKQLWILQERFCFL